MASTLAGYDDLGNPISISFEDLIPLIGGGKGVATAWVNFDGTTTPPTIRDSYNVSSVARLATGNYEIYFTTPMDNANYSHLTIGENNNTNNLAVGFSNGGATTTKLTIWYLNSADAVVNGSEITTHVFGGKN